MQEEALALRPEFNPMQPVLSGRSGKIKWSVPQHIWENKVPSKVNWSSLNDIEAKHLKSQLLSCHPCLAISVTQLVQVLKSRWFLDLNPLHLCKFRCAFVGTCMLTLLRPTNETQSQKKDDQDTHQNNQPKMWNTRFFERMIVIW